MSWQGLELVHVVAMSQNRCIGKDNALPWHLPADLQHFKTITQGGVMVMGRKTYQDCRSFGTWPYPGKPPHSNPVPLLSEIHEVPKKQLENGQCSKSGYKRRKLRTYYIPL